MIAEKWIIDLVNSRVDYAQKQLTLEQCNLAAAKAGYKEWHKNNPDDGVGGISGCPYHPESAEEAVVKAREYLDITTEAYNLILHKLLTRQCRYLVHVNNDEYNCINKYSVIANSENDARVMAFILDRGLEDVKYGHDSRFELGELQLALTYTQVVHVTGEI